ncbi:MAG: DNA polymerase IV [Firmicutes bacterium]|jgi:DNA polymerase-4|nr:DNA polymerase IV [Bacillota bacterium]
MATIMHVDMDSFFAAVEQRDNPELRGKPVIVGGSRDSKRGVVSTCSYEARKYGVHSAMPIAQAVKLCPHGIFIPGNHKKYAAVSRQIRSVFYQFSPLVEVVSIDEAFLDMTGCEHLYQSLEDLGRAVKRKIFETVSLTASVGIGPNKFIAKLASDYRKPDGLVVIKPEAVWDWLAPFPVKKVWGIGKKTAEVLASWQVLTIADLRQCSQESLIRQFGKQGLTLYLLARGIDHRQVEPGSEAKSLGRETTFVTDITAVSKLRQVLADLAAEVGYRLRREGCWARTVTLKLRYDDFTTITRSTSLPEPINNDDDIFDIAHQLLVDNLGQRPVRLLGIYVSQLTPFGQASLFSDPRREKLTRLMDELKARHGRPVLYKGRQLPLDDPDLSE